MSGKPMDERQVRGEVQELERQLIAMGNMVESLFADSVMALVERTPGVLPGLRAEDCRAHERWLEIDKFCTELLINGELDPEQVRFISAAIKIASDLKRTADECVRIGEGVRSCELDSLATAGSLASIPPMAALTQSMLSDAIEAFIRRDAAQAAALHLVFRELASLNGRAVKELSEGIAGGEIPAAVGAAFVGVAQRLERIGDDVLSIANQVRHLDLRNSHQ
ncbi:MAG: hypothetical protein KAX19_01405 [Candidatus Brocadiae bacterium]|nr:hypothetical protein [Candidatus Brocadiia bacterium]